MVQPITNYTTYDLAYYYADLARLPRVSREERERLLLSAQATPLNTQGRAQLIESYLRFTTAIAIDRCPPSYYRALPDILGEVNVTLVNLVNRYDFQAGNDFTSYLAVYTEGTFKNAIVNERLIKVPYGALTRARENGTEKALYELQPESLDVLMQWYNTSELEEPPTSPLLPRDPAPPRNPILREQVQEWLSYLPERDQRVLSLHYGLSDEDERCYTIAEIARMLNLKRGTVQAIERDAKKRIRALVEETGTIIEKNGVRQVTGIYTFKPPTITPEQEARFLQAARRLQAQGISVSSRSLAKETSKGVHTARIFLKNHRDQLSVVVPPKQRSREERLTELARAYADLVARGERVTYKRLARAAQVSNGLALEFSGAERGA